MKCKECGWELEYIPCSFQEQIREIMGELERKGYWRCPNCGFKKRRIGEIVRMRRKKPYPEECVLVPITGEIKPCIEGKCYQWDLEQNKYKLIVCEREI